MPGFFLARVLLGIGVEVNMPRHEHDRYDTPWDLASFLAGHLLRGFSPDVVIEPYCGSAPFVRAAVDRAHDRTGLYPHVVTIDSDPNVIVIAQNEPGEISAPKTRARVDITTEHYTGDFRELSTSIPIPDSARSVAILANPPFRGTSREGVGEHLRALYTCAMDLRHGHKVDVRLGALVPITALAGMARRALWRDIADCYLTVYVLTPRPSFDGEGGTANAEYIWCEWSDSDFQDSTRIEWLEWKD